MNEKYLEKPYPPRSLSEIWQLCLLFSGSLISCLILGCFIGGFGHAWDSISQFLGAIAAGAGWGIFVVLSACIVSCLVSAWAFKTRFFAKHQNDSDKGVISFEDNLGEIILPKEDKREVIPIPNNVREVIPIPNNVQVLISQAQYQFFQNVDIPESPPIELTANGIAGYLGIADISRLMRTCKGFWRMPELHNTLGLKLKLKPLIAAGEQQSFLYRNGALYGTGVNNCGQLGVGSIDQHINTFTAINIPGLEIGKGGGVGVQIRQIAIGCECTFILLTNGKLYGCGSLGEATFGHTGLKRYFKEVTIPGLQGPIKQVVMGYVHAIVLSADGRLYGCGRNAAGQLGLGEKIKECNFFRPLTISKESNVRIKKVAAGREHTVVLSEDGQLYGCGSNYIGQLGLEKNRAKYYSFTLMTIPRLPSSSIKQVSAGRICTVVLLENGQLYGCGDNTQGQLNCNPNDYDWFSIFSRLNIPDLGQDIKIKQVVTGGDYTLILYTNGALYGCGDNSVGQLGSVGGRCFPTFRLITIPDMGDAQIQQVTAGGGHTLVLLDDGRLYGCGGYDASALGFGKPDMRNRPARPTPFTQIPSPETLLPSATYGSLNK
jgi:alpha-tubulin suppressor-like RCC1 family protein